MSPLLTPLRGMQMVLALLAPLLAPACSTGPILRSEPLSPGRALPVEWVGYYLPKRLVRVDLYVQTSRLTIPKMDTSGHALRDDKGQPIIETTSKTEYFALLADQPIIPDLRHHFTIVQRESSSSDDVVDVGLTPDGLLTHVCGTARDRTPDIAKSFADLVSLLVTAPVRLAGPGHLRSADDEVDPVRVAVFEFDPVDPVDFSQAKQELSKFGVTLTVTRQSDCPVATSGNTCCTTCAVSQPGIYYRLPIPYRLRLAPGGVLEDRKIVGLRESVSETVLLPNEAICKFVPVTRASFVTKKTDLKFEQGMLTKVSTDKPSELLGFVQIPIDAASAILAIPAELLTLRIKRTNDEKQLVENETSLKEAEADKVEAMTRLLEAMQKAQEARARTGGR